MKPEINTETAETVQTGGSRAVVQKRLVRLLSVAWEGWWEVFLFVPAFSFRNVFFIERSGGPITYLFALAILPVAPLLGASCGIAQALINIDEELCKPNTERRATADNDQTQHPK